MSSSPPDATLIFCVAGSFEVVFEPPLPHAAKTKPSATSPINHFSVSYQNSSFCSNNLPTFYMIFHTFVLFQHLLFERKIFLRIRVDRYFSGGTVLKTENRRVTVSFSEESLWLVEKT